MRVHRRCSRTGATRAPLGCVETPMRIPCPLHALMVGLMAIDASYTHAQPGTLDPTFGSAGIATIDIATVYDYGQAVAVQPDGRIVMAGYAYSDLVLARFMPDGAPDPSFGTGGLVTLPGCAAYAMMLQDDGYIVVGGSHGGPADAQAMLMRFDPNGIPDPHFGDAGRVSFGDPGTSEYIEGLAIQADGRIVGVGTKCGDFPYCEFLVVRVLGDGTPDASFGSGGSITVDITAEEERGYGVAVREDGRLVITGQYGSNMGPGIFLFGLNADGGMDNTFMPTLPSGVGPSWSYTVRVLADDKLLVAGAMFNGQQNDFILLRYEADGSLDEGFGDGGIVLTDLYGNTDNSITVVEQADGKLIQVGTTIDAQFGRSIALVRFHPDGAIDRAFGDNGRVITDLAGDDEMAFDAALQPDGKLVITGYVRTDGDEDLLVARYLTAMEGMEVGETGTNDPLRVRSTPEGPMLESDGVVDAHLMLTDLQGRTVVSRAWNGGPLLLSDLAAGPYLAVVRKEGQRWTRKLLVGGY